LPPVKTKNTEQETEILSLIKKNLLFDKPKTKFAKGEFVKTYINKDKNSNAPPPERYHSSQLIGDLEVKGSNKGTTEVSAAGSKTFKANKFEEKLQPVNAKKPAS